MDSDNLCYMYNTHREPQISRKLVPEITTIQIRDDKLRNLKEMLQLSPVNILYLYNMGRELCTACAPTYTELFYEEKIPNHLK